MLKHITTIGNLIPKTEQKQINGGSNYCPTYYLQLEITECSQICGVPPQYRMCLDYPADCEDACGGTEY
ncbi:MAG: hypothetical protein WBA74_15205 [Cyclobacteriaceae bacterium]